LRLQVDVSISKGSSSTALVPMISLFAAWISLDISGQSILTDESDVYYCTAPIMIGTPPQQVDMTINTYSTLLAAFAYDCALCAGSTFFDHSQSSSFGVHTLLYNSFKTLTYHYFSKSSNRTWAASSSQLTGSYFEDTVGFGSLTVDKADFGIILIVPLHIIWLIHMLKFSSRIWP
jgi:hypothetical protein